MIVSESKGPVSSEQQQYLEIHPCFISIEDPITHSMFFQELANWSLMIANSTRDGPYESLDLPRT